jgi:hypothetical protein
LLNRLPSGLWSHQLKPFPRSLMFIQFQRHPALTGQKSLELFRGDAYALRSRFDPSLSGHFREAWLKDFEGKAVAVTGRSGT